MGIDLTAKLVETAYKVAITRNQDGDVNYGTQTSTPCLYRDISMRRQAANSVDAMLDGLLWFGPTEDVSRGDVYYHPDEGYLQIEKVIRAKRLVADNSVQFIKCEVTKQRQIS